MQDKNTDANGEGKALTGVRWMSSSATGGGGSEHEDKKETESTLIYSGPTSVVEDTLERSLKELSSLASQLRRVLSPTTEKVFPLKNSLSSLMDDLQTLQHRRPTSRSTCVPRATLIGTAGSGKTSTMNFLLNKEESTRLDHASSSDVGGGKSQNKSISFADEDAPPLLGDSSSSPHPSPLHTESITPSPPVMTRRGKNMNPVLTRFTKASALQPTSSPLSPVGSPLGTPLLAKETTSVFSQTAPPLATFVHLSSVNGSFGERSRVLDDGKKNLPPLRGVRGGAGRVRRKSTTVTTSWLGPTIVELLERSPMTVPTTMLNDSRTKVVLGEGIGFALLEREGEQSDHGALSTSTSVSDQPPLSAILAPGLQSSSPVFLSLNKTTSERSLLELTAARLSVASDDPPTKPSSHNKRPSSPYSRPPVQQPPTTELPWVLQEAEEGAIRWEGPAFPQVPAAALADAVFFCIRASDVMKEQWGFLSLLFPPFMEPSSLNDYGSLGSWPTHIGTDTPLLSECLRQSVVSQTVFIFTGMEHLQSEKESSGPITESTVLGVCRKFLDYMNSVYGVTIQHWQLIPFSYPLSRIARDFLYALYDDSQGPSTSAVKSPPTPLLEDSQTGAWSLRSVGSTSVSAVLPKSILSPTPVGPLPRLKVNQLPEATNAYCSMVFGPPFFSTEMYRGDRETLLQFIRCHAQRDLWYRSGAFYLYKLARDFEHHSSSFVVSQGAASVMMWSFQLLRVLPKAAETASSRVKVNHDKLTHLKERREVVEKSIQQHQSKTPLERVVSVENRMQEVFSFLAERFLRDVRSILVDQKEPSEMDVQSDVGLQKAYKRFLAVCTSFRAFFIERRADRELFFLNVRIEEARKEMDAFTQNYLYFTLLNQPSPTRGDNPPEERPPPPPRASSVIQATPPAYVREREPSVRQEAQFQLLEHRWNQLLQTRRDLEVELITHVSQMNTEMINFFLAFCFGSLPYLRHFVSSEIAVTQNELGHFTEALKQTKPPQDTFPLDELKDAIDGCDGEDVLSMRRSSELTEFISVLRSTLCEDQIRSLAMFHTATAKERLSPQPPSTTTTSPQTSRPRRMSGVGAKVQVVNTVVIQELFSPDTAVGPENYFRGLPSSKSASVVSSTSDIKGGKDTPEGTEPLSTRPSLPNPSDSLYFLSHRVFRFMQRWCRQNNPFPDIRRRDKVDFVFLPSEMPPITYPTVLPSKRRSPVSSSQDVPSFFTSNNSQEKQVKWKLRLQEWRDTTRSLPSVHLKEHAMVWILLNAWEEVLLSMPYHPWFSLDTTGYGETLSKLSLSLQEMQLHWAAQMGERIDDLEVNTDALEREVIRLTSAKTYDSAVAVVRHVFKAASEIGEALSEVRNESLKTTIRLKQEGDGGPTS